MHLIERAEKIVRFLGKDIVPPPTKRKMWYYYMTAKRILKTKSLTLPANVQIEVNTHCNRGCWYCSNKDFPKAPQLMDDEIYKKIIDDLTEIDFRGRIAPHQSSEPLLHPRLTELAAYARDQLPRAEFAIYTNGDFLNRERFDELREAGVDTWIITQHGQNAPRPLLELVHNLTPEESEYVTYQTLDAAKLFNRCIPGLIPEERRAIPNPCFHASYHLQVLVNGDVAQCCMGFMGEHIFGNVMKRNLMDIWMDPVFRTFRKEVGHGQFKLDVCQRCVSDAPSVKPQRFIQIQDHLPYS